MSADDDTLGQRLGAARERKGLTVQKASDALHVDAWIIEGLESGDYSRIGPAVYVKGHLRRYVELLGLPAAEMLERFDGRAPPPTLTQASGGLRLPGLRGSGDRLPWPRIAGAAVAVIIVAGVWLWRPWHPRNAVARPAAVQVAAPAGADAPAASAVPGVASTPAAGVEPVPAGTEPTPGSGRARLRLSFTGDSWVDVHDAAGQRLFAGTGHANNVRSMVGEAPFRVYLKAASSIRLEINNHVVAVGPAYVVDNVARFEVGSDGVMRRDPRPRG